MYKQFNSTSYFYKPEKKRQAKLNEARFNNNNNNNNFITYGLNHTKSIQKYVPTTSDLRTTTKLPVDIDTLEKLKEIFQSCVINNYGTVIIGNLLDALKHVNNTPTLYFPHVTSDYVHVRLIKLLKLILYNKMILIQFILYVYRN